ncbi:hypothetical protein D3C72_1952100 [compost metagenome]
MQGFPDFTGFLQAAARCLADICENAESLCLQVTAFRREADDHLPFVAGVALATDIACRLQPLQKGGQRSRIEPDLLADTLDRHFVLLPERQQHEILRVGKAETIEQRLVRAVEGMRGRIDGETELFAER